MSDPVAVSPAPTFSFPKVRGIGFATTPVGLILVRHWLGHASFHADKYLVE